MAIKKNLEIVVDTKDAEKNVNQLNKSIENTETSVKDVNKTTEDTSKTFDKFSGGAVGRLKGMKSSIGAVVSSFKNLRVAIIATGLGALLIIITSIITAFKSSEEGQNKYAKLLGVIGAVVGNLVDLIADFGEVLIDAITNPRKAWDSFVDTLEKGYKFIKGQVVDRFKASWTILSSGIEAGILKMRIAWNEFTGDAEEAEELKTQLKEVQEEVIKAAKVINEKNQEIVDIYNKATDAVKGFIDQNIKEANLAAKVADDRAKADKLERKLIIERATLENKIAQLRLKSREEDRFTAKERREALIEAQKLEDQLLEKETEVLKLRAEAIALENTFARSTKENLKAEVEAAAAVIQQQAARTNSQRQTQRELNRINKEITANEKRKIKEQENLLKEQEEKEKKRIEKQVKEEEEKLKKIAEVREKFRLMNEDLEDVNEEAKLERQKQRDIEALEQLKGSEAEKQQARLNIQEFYAKKQQELRDKNAKEEEKRDNLVANSKVQIAENVSNLVSQIAGKDSAVAKGVAVAQATISGIEGVQNTFTTASKSPITTVFPAYPYIQAGLSGAFSALQIRQILKTDSTGKSTPTLGSGAGAQPSTASAPAFNLVQGTEGNQIAESIGNQQNEPVQAYVVSGEMTSQQQLDRQIESRATL